MVDNIQPVPVRHGNYLPLISHASVVQSSHSATGDSGVVRAFPRQQPNGIRETIAGIGPTAEELVCVALHATDFLADLTGDPLDLAANVTKCIAAAAELWTDTHHGERVPAATLAAARAALTAEAHAILAARAQAAEAALWDAHEAGDLAHDGSAISYPKSRSI